MQENRGGLGEIAELLDGRLPCSYLGYASLVRPCIILDVLDGDLSMMRCLLKRRSAENEYVVMLVVRPSELLSSLIVTATLMRQGDESSSKVPELLQASLFC